MSLLSHSLSSSSDFFWLGHKKQFPSVTVCNWKVNCGKMKLTLSSLPFCVCFLTSFIFSPKSSPLFLLTTLLSTLLSPFQLTGSRQITNQASLQRRWSRLRSRSLLLGKADQEASHQRGQISLSSPRQTSSKSSTCLSVQPVPPFVLNKKTPVLTFHTQTLTWTYCYEEIPFYLGKKNVTFIY